MKQKIIIDRQADKYPYDFANIAPYLEKGWKVVSITPIASPYRDTDEFIFVLERDYDADAKEKPETETDDEDAGPKQWGIERLIPFLGEYGFKNTHTEVYPSRSRADEGRVIEMVFERGLNKIMVREFIPVCLPNYE